MGEREWVRGKDTHKYVSTDIQGTSRWHKCGKSIVSHLPHLYLLHLLYFTLQPSATLTCPYFHPHLTHPCLHLSHSHLPHPYPAHFSLSYIRSSLIPLPSPVKINENKWKWNAPCLHNTILVYLQKWRTQSDLLEWIIVIHDGISVVITLFTLCILFTLHWQTNTLILHSLHTMKSLCTFKYIYTLICTHFYTLYYTRSI